MEFKDDKIYITVKDHSVSGEEFQLIIDENLELLKTHPQPPAGDLGKYYDSEDYISHTDGKRSLFENIYHAVKQKALKDKLSIIKKYKPVTGSILDIGAGTGDFLHTAKKAGWNITGTEPSEKARAAAKTKNINLHNDTISIADKSQDVITMWHVLEHVPDLDAQIKELKRLLKPDGTIFIAVPNYKSYDAKYYKEFWAAYDVPRHLWHFSKTSIKKIFDKYQVELVDVLSMKFDSFYVSMLSEKYKTGKMNFLKGFWRGLLSNSKAASNKEYSSHIYVLKSAKN